ncbi:hypothetical protein AK830_g10708 [Neonectria ditissima]|uniref:Protein kinase domain-containing protein n=1 Tax=Neonectria ditissima TaxID=78410 RepID=A0A0P7B6N9_9HYPO|nr:hypothetical protein AK830_g10708 [Neonectria ditissima]
MIPLKSCEAALERYRWARLVFTILSQPLSIFWRQDLSMSKEKGPVPWNRRSWTRINQPWSKKWVKAMVLLTLVLGSLHGPSMVYTHRKALLDKFTATTFDHLAPKEKQSLTRKLWKWEDSTESAVDGPLYLRQDIWAHRHEWKPLGSGSEGEAFTYNNTVIKIYKTAHHPFRNCVPAIVPEMRWPTEIAATLVLGGMAVPQSFQQDTAFLPVTDYFLSPATETQSPKWHFLTQFLPMGNLAKLSKRLHDSDHSYNGLELDMIFRASMERLLQALGRMHEKYDLCHDDIKLDNIWLSGSEDLEGAKHWILADLGNVRELSHPYHFSMLWSKLNNNLPDCRANDVLRLLKAYVRFLREAVDDVATFDMQFFQAQEPWAQLFWSTWDAAQTQRPVSASADADGGLAAGPEWLVPESSAACTCWGKAVEYLDTNNNFVPATASPDTPTTMPVKLVYHDGHYHTAQVTHEDGQNEHQGGLWQKTSEVWDQILYGIGSVYFKLCGR